MQTQFQNEPVTEERANSSNVPVARRAKRLRVLHVVPRLGTGGTEHGILKVMNGLGEEQFEHRICAMRGIDTEFAQSMNLAGKTYSAGTANPGFQFPLFRLRKIMKEYCPHVVHTRNFGALEGVAAARFAGIPVAVHSEHGYELEIMQGLPLRRRLLCRGLYAMADAVFMVTKDLRDYHARQSWMPAEKLRVVHNGVDTHKFSPRPESKAGIRAEWKIPVDRVAFGSVGRLVPIKDHGTFLRAAEDAISQGQNVHVLIVGSGPEQTKLQEYANASPMLAGRVTFAGASSRVAELLNAMDVFVLPSICEGMSNTILEAMACGLPVVVTRAGGNPEVVDDGRSGCLFEPRDVRALSEILRRFASDAELRRQFAESARRRAVENFSLETMLRSYRDLYFELATQRGVDVGS